MSSRQLNGHKNNIDDIEAESELSEPDSNVHSPPGVALHEEEDQIIVGAKTNGGRKPLPTSIRNEDFIMTDAHDEPVSHYPKRKRTSVFNDLSESKMEMPGSGTDAKPAPPLFMKPKPARQSLGGVKGVVLGQWRDSPVPDLESKHAVIGFIDVRDRLRTRIQPFTLSGEPVSSEFPLPPGPGGSWVTFERVIFTPHLVGLDHFQVKEYVRLRTEVFEDTDEERRIAEKAAVSEAIQRVKDNPLFLNPTVQPAMAHGPDLPEPLSPGRQDNKRRRVSGGFAVINPGPSANGAHDQQSNQTALQSPQSATSAGFPGPLPGTRPTRIVLGYWRGSSEIDVVNRHAVYGILGQNDMFRVKVVRETRDGRFVDGNFPTGAGALWIQWEEVEFDPHLKPLTRQEIKEYCRVRQYQLDQGETSDERADNEISAVSEAQTRAGAGYKHIPQQQQQQQQQSGPSSIAGLASDSVPFEQTNGKTAVNGGHELRQSRRTDSRAEGRTPRQSLNETDIRASARVDSEEPRSASRLQNPEGLERANALARREIARVEAAQGRADRHAVNRERAAAVASDATAAAAAAAVAAATGSPGPAYTNGRSRIHESEDMQRLNRVWARQESLRMKAGSEDAKMYDGIKYERKTTGPFMGKLVSQGTIISIEGEDYVEYRVLTKPSFF